MEIQETTLELDEIPLSTVSHPQISFPRRKVKRPSEWEGWSEKQRMKWLRDQRREFRGRPTRLKERDKNRVQILMTTLNNKSLVAERLGISRHTLYRFLKRFSISSKEITIEILEQNGEAPDLTDYPEIQTWYNRQLMHAKETTTKGYLSRIRGFYKYMLENHSSRARPSLWTSDDILGYIRLHEPYQEKSILDALRQLANKAQEKFPYINLALLPTKKAYQAKRSHAGKQEYYYNPEQIKALIENVPAKSKFQETRNKAMLGTMYNTAIRVGDPSDNRGLLGMKVENLHLDQHMAKVKDKGNQWWLVYGLTDSTIKLIKDYLKERNKIVRGKGYLWINENGYPLRYKQLNAIIKKAGKKAGIKGKKFTSKIFRKSFVKHALESGIRPTSLIGTGKSVKTCFCVGWSGQKAIDTIMTFYAPQLLAQIERDREKFKWS